MSRLPGSVACRFHQTVATPLCCCTHVSPNLGFVHWIDATQQLKKRKSGCLNLFVGKYACWMGFRVFRCQAHPRIDFHSIDFSLVLADVGIAMENGRKAHRPHVPAKVFRLYDMFTVAMTQQALLLDQTSECTCASATSCCVCGHADDEASLTTCATCVMNYHKECVETFVQ